MRRSIIYLNDILFSQAILGSTNGINNDIADFSAEFGGHMRRSPEKISCILKLS